MFRMIGAAAAALALGACSTQPMSEGSSYSIPENSTFVLNQDVTVPEGWSRVFVQYGKVIEPRKLNKFDPYCQIVQIELTRAGADPQVIMADQFRTGSVVRRSISAAPTGTLLASSGSSLMDGDNRSSQTWVTEISLRSERQPQVRKLICGSWNDNVHFERWLRLREIRSALGNLATLSVN